MARSELSRQVGIFNKQLQRLSLKNQWWNEVFEKQSAAALRKNSRTETDALREIERLNALLKGEQNRREVPYLPTSEIKIPEGALKQIETLLSRGNKLAEKKYKAFPEFTGSKGRSIEKERYRPLTKGDGLSLKSVQARIRTIKNRANPEWNKQLESAYLTGFLASVNNYMPQYYNAIKQYADKVKNPFGFYIAAVNARYGGHLQIEYVYPSDEDVSIKAENIIDALEQYLQEEKDGLWDYNEKNDGETELNTISVLDIFEE